MCVSGFPAAPGLLFWLLALDSSSLSDTVTACGLAAVQFWSQYCEGRSCYVLRIAAVNPLKANTYRRGNRLNTRRTTPTLSFFCLPPSARFFCFSRFWVSRYSVYFTGPRGLLPLPVLAGQWQTCLSLCRKSSLCFFTKKTLGRHSTLVNVRQGTNINADFVIFIWPLPCTIYIYLVVINLSNTTLSSGCTFM